MHVGQSTGAIYNLLIYNLSAQQDDCRMNSCLATQTLDRFVCMYKYSPAFDLKSLQCESNNQLDLLVL